MTRASMCQKCGESHTTLKLKGMLFIANVMCLSTRLNGKKGIVLLVMSRHKRNKNAQGKHIFMHNYSNPAEFKPGSLVFAYTTIFQLLARLGLCVYALKNRMFDKTLCV